MGRLHKIQISRTKDKIETRITVNAVDICTYTADGWTVETEPYIDEPIAIKQANTDAQEAQDDVKADEANVDTTADDNVAEASVDEDLLVD